MGLMKDERERAKQIVDELFEESFRYSEKTSYDIKHIIERITGYYISNDEMKAIMMDAGYYPDSAMAINPRYKVRFKRL